MPRTRYASCGGRRAPAPIAAGWSRADGRTESCLEKRRSRWWSWLRPRPMSARRRQPLSSERARLCPAGPPFLPAVSTCFQRDIACRTTGPDRSALSEACARIRSPAASRAISREQPDQPRRDLIEWQNGSANAGIRRGARHSPHHTRSFVLGDHTAAGRDDVLAAAHAVRAHAGQHEGENAGVPDVDRGSEQRVDRRLAEIDRWPVIKRDYGLGPLADHPHVARARRDIDLARLDDLAIDGFVGRPMT